MRRRLELLQFYHNSPRQTTLNTIGIRLRSIAARSLHVKQTTALAIWRCSLLLRHSSNGATTWGARATKLRWLLIIITCRPS